MLPGAIVLRLVSRGGGRPSCGLVVADKHMLAQGVRRFELRLCSVVLIVFHKFSEHSLKEDNETQRL
jgi:hypothetical protein